MIVFLFLLKTSTVGTQFMFRAKIIKNGIPLNPPFYFLKVGSKEVFIAWTCFHDVYWAL